MTPVVTRDGVRLALVQSGAGRVMLFQHGLCGDAAQPAQVFPEGTGFGCLTLECRGHGASDAGPVTEISIAQFTDDLADVLDGLRLKRVVVGGISLGAALALRLAVIRPDLVGGLVLARPAWATGAAPANMAPNALVGELLATLHPAEARRQFEASAVARDLAVTGPDNLTSLRGFFDRTPQAVTSALLTRISADGPGVSPQDLARLDLPVLVIGHGRDAVHPLALAQGLAGMIPGARLVEITAKADDPARYRHDFRAALAAYLNRLSETEYPDASRS